MKYYNLGYLSGLDAMTVFHALAHAGEEGLVIVSPTDPFVSLGYFQRLETSVDREFCRRSNLPLIRREIGGGTVYLDRNQIFYHLVFHKDNPRFPGDIMTLYRTISQPVIDTYADLGIPVRFKVVNDLVTVDGSRKISGEGGSDIGDMRVFVGSILLDFDCETMSRVFPSRNEAMRQQLLQSLNSSMTTVLKETGRIPPREWVVERLADHYTAIGGPLEPAELPQGILAQARLLEKIYTSDSYLQKAGRSAVGTRIASGVDVYENMFKAAGGRIFSSFEVRGNILANLRLYGDFTFLPKEKLADLETALTGTPLDSALLAAKAEQFIAENNIDCPGITPVDIAAALTLPEAHRI